MPRSTFVQLRRSVATLCGLFILVAAAQVLAAKPRVGVPVFQGHGEGPVRAKIIKALKTNGYQIVGGKQLKATASSAGANLDTNDGFAAVAKELAISAFVTGDIGKKKATLTVRNGSDGFVLGEASFNGANPGKIKAAVAAGFWRRLGSAVSKGTPPAGAKAKTTVAEEAEPVDSEEGKGSGADSTESGGDSKEAVNNDSNDKDSESSSKSEPAAEERKTPARRSKEAPRHAEAESSEAEGGLKALQLGVGAEAFWRNLTPHDDPANSLSTNRISPGGAGVLWLEAYPAAFSSTGFAANIGVVGGLEKALAISSKTAGGQKFSTSYLAWDVGLKLRFPLGGAVPFFAATYGKQSYDLTAQGGGTKPSSILDVDYTYVAGTVGGTFLLAPSFNLDVKASYLLVTNPGADIKADFKNAKAYAVDLGASAVFYVTPVIGLRAGLDFRQYGLDFKLKSADAPTIIVGGATDRYVRLWGGLEIAFDGAGGAAPEAPKPAPKKAAPRAAAVQD